MPIVTIIYVWLQFISLMIKEPRVSAVIADRDFLPAALMMKRLRRFRVIMLNRSVPIVNGLKGKIVFVHFRILLILFRSVVDAFTAITPPEAEEFSRLGGIRREKVAVIPSVVSPAFNQYKPAGDKYKLRRQLGIDGLVGTKKVVLYHGVLDARRGVHGIVRSFEQAFSNREDILLLIVGQGSAMDSLVSHVYKSGIKNCVVMGKIPYTTIPQLISACDLGLVMLPDLRIYRYQCPLKLVELLSMGKPVVASNLPGIRWAAGDSSLVTYVHSFDKVELKRAIISALNATRKSSQRMRNIFYHRFASREAARELAKLVGTQ